MKKILILVIFSLILVFNVVGAENGKREVKMAYLDVPPHIYQDEKTGELKGAAYDLLEKYIAPEINVKFVWDTQPTVVPRELELLDTQKDYAAALLVYTPERAQKVIFPETPYMPSKPALALLKDYKLEKINTIDDIAGLVIGYGSQATITPFMKSDKIKFEMVSAANFTEINLKKLLAKRIDAVYMPGNTSLLYYMRQLNFDQEFKLINLPEKPSILNIAFSQGLKDVADSYNKAYKKLNGEKLYITILSKYIDTSKL